MKTSKKPQMNGHILPNNQQPTINTTWKEKHEELVEMSKHDASDFHLSSGKNNIDLCTADIHLTLTGRKLSVPSEDCCCSVIGSRGHCQTKVGPAIANPLGRIRKPLVKDTALLLYKLQINSRQRSGYGQHEC